MKPAKDIADMLNADDAMRTDVLRYLAEYDLVRFRAEAHQVTIKAPVPSEVRPTIVEVPIAVYVLLCKTSKYKFLKFGISRDQTLIKRYSKRGVVVKVLVRAMFSSELIARQTEQRIKDTVRGQHGGGHGSIVSLNRGWTETTAVEALQDIVAVLESSGGALDLDGVYEYYYPISGSN